MRKIILGAVLALAAMLLTPASAPAIVNGSDAATNPGAVSLWTDNPNRNRCTGVLVDDEQGHPNKTRWVYTAAHCVYPFTDPAAGRVTARIGSANNSTGYVAIKVVPGQFWWNPAFNPDTLASDAMLMLLEEETPLQLADGTPVQIMKWRKPSLPVGAITTAYGWGWRCDGPAGLSCSSWYQGPLQRMNAARLPDTDCAGTVDVTQVCFRAAPDGYTMACPGDSGGPMKSPDFDGTPILRWAIVGDGDSNWDSCTQGPNGTPGRGLAINVGNPDIQAWMGATMAGTARTSRAALPEATPRILGMIN